MEESPVETGLELFINWLAWVVLSGILLAPYVLIILFLVRG